MQYDQMRRAVDAIEIAVEQCQWARSEGLEPIDVILRYGPRDFYVTGWPTWIDAIRAVHATAEDEARRARERRYQLRLPLAA